MQPDREPTNLPEYRLSQALYLRCRLDMQQASNWQFEAGGSQLKI